MKAKEQLEARNLRSNGLPMKQIAKKLKVSPGSVWLWTHDINLTREQKEKIKNELKGIVVKARRGADSAFLKRPKEDKEKGIWKARNHNDLFLAGCILYWGEGTKKGLMVNLANADPLMIRVFIRFLQNEFGVKPNDMRWRFSCYTDIHSADEVAKYWQEKTGLLAESMTRPALNQRPKSSKRIRSKSEYGTCYVRVSSASVQRQIRNAIDELKLEILA